MGGWEEYRVLLRLLDSIDYSAVIAISGQKRLADKTTIHMQLRSMVGEGQRTSIPGEDYKTKCYE